MMMTRLRFHHGWASLIGLLFAAAIAFFLYAAYLSFHQNIRPEMTEAREMLDALSDSPAPAVSSLPERGAMESMTHRIEAINERNRQHGDDLMKEIGAMHEVR